MTSSLGLLVPVLLQMGFTQTQYVTILAVSSYLAFSSLPTSCRRLFSVALSLRFPSQDVILHHCSVEPGLSSYAAFRLCYTRLFNLLFCYFSLILYKCQVNFFTNVYIQHIIILPDVSIIQSIN